MKIIWLNNIEYIKSGSVHFYSGPAIELTTVKILVLSIQDSYYSSLIDLTNTGDLLYFNIYKSSEYGELITKELVE